MASVRCLHPDKTKIVHCKDYRRRLSHEHTCLTFFGLHLPQAESPNQKTARAWSPRSFRAVSKDSLKLAICGQQGPDGAGVVRYACLAELDYPAPRGGVVAGS